MYEEEEANDYFADISDDDAKKDDSATAGCAADYVGSRLQRASSCNRARVGRNYSRSEETTCAPSTRRLAAFNK